MLAAGSTGCAKPRPAETSQAAPELRLEGVTFRLYRGQTLRAEGRAVELSYRRERAEVSGTRLEVTLPRGGAPVVVTAPAGAGSLSNRTFQASGGVRLVRGEDVAVTEAARFDPAQGRQGLVVGDDPVELSGRGYRLRGDRFTIDAADGTVAVAGHARLVAGLPGGR